jgi:pilus assembly protein FimV
MSRKLIFLALLSLILAPGAASSAGLGEIRLDSYLNQPLRAEIALSVGSAEEFETLRVELASAEAFSRYGLDRPAFLDEFRFDVRNTGPSSGVVQVSSAGTMTEPFVTFLVEARWSGGRILREYTVLLDPPIFLPAREAAPATAVDAPRPAPVAREAAPAPVPAAPPAPAATVDAPAMAPRSVGADAGSEFGPVQRNDTLWAIAQRVRPDAGLTTNQVMVALFRSNPGAFDGNINRLRAGAILRVPSRDEMAAASGAEATSEVQRHNEDWRAAAPATAPVERRLELAPPADSPRPAAPVTALASDPAAASPELRDDVQQLRSELDEVRTLIEIRDAEIAALQARLAELQADSVAPAPAEVAAPGTAAEPAAESTVIEPEPAPAAAPAAPAPPVSAPPPGLLDRAMGALSSLWLWLVIAAILVIAAVLVFVRKRGAEDERSIEDDLAETGTWGTLPGAGGSATAPRAAAPAIAAAAGQKEDFASILVDETPLTAAPRATEPAPVPRPAPRPAPREEEADLDGLGDDEYQYPFEDTIAGETGINLDQSDPMAEADFHMAYGLYDQAADIIKKAVDREPDRYDLRRKLIDICFVWGNGDEFLVQAKGLRAIAGDEHAADWAKVSIMGRQICPGEPMFAAGRVPDIDINLDASLVLPLPDIDTSASGEWLDFDVGESDAASAGDTREQPAIGARRPIDHTAELDLEELGLDLDLGESGEHALQDRFEPMPESLSGEPREHTGTLNLGASAPGFAAAGHQAEDTRLLEGMDEDDSGTQMMDMSGMKVPGDDPTREGEFLGLGEDDPTLSGLTGINESDLVDPTQQTLGVSDEEPTLSGLDADSVSEEEDDDARTFIKQFVATEDSPTTEVESPLGGLDLDLDDLTQSLEADLAAYGNDSDATRLAYRSSGEPRNEDEDATMMAPALDTPEDVATLLAPRPEIAADSYEIGDTRQMPPPESNEVGTKLDLARAYIDMGDPEGARSILEEVVDEGNEAQRDEARELLGGLD